MNNLVIAGAAGIILIIGVLFFGQNRFHAGEAAQVARGEQAVREAEAKTAEVEAQLADMQKERDDAKRKLDEQRTSEFDAAVRVSQPVRLCDNRPSRREVPAVPDAVASTGATAGSDNLPLQAGRDIGPALLVLARDAQADRDARVELYAQLQACWAMTRQAVLQ